MELTGKHKGGIRAFCHFGRRFPDQFPDSQGIVDEIAIGVYYDEGVTTGEFMIKWHNLSDYFASAPQLAAFNDAWAVLVEIFPDLLKTLAEIDDRDIQPQEMCDRLVALGIQDWTDKRN